MIFIFNKKGSDKPIEIFVSLFLILAVAMVLLKMFSGQVADKGNELEDYSKKQNAIALCEQACSDTKSNRCRPEDQIRFCIKNFKLDYNGDSVLGVNKDDFTFDFCEDKIYCPIVIDCECGVKLSLSNCEKIMDKYYTKLGVADVKNTILGKLKYSEGLCTSTSSSWFNMFLTCTPTDKSCDGDSVITCQADGTWDTGTACTGGKICESGSCSCKSHSSYSCDSGDVYWYNSCGVKEIQKNDCGGNGCTGNTCVSPTPECTAPETSCSIDKLKTCKADGTWGAEVSCPNGQVCNAAGNTCTSGAAATYICSSPNGNVGDIECDAEGKPITCQSDGSWNIGSCAPGYACVSGTGC